MKNLHQENEMIKVTLIFQMHKQVNVGMKTGQKANDIAHKKRVKALGWEQRHKGE